MFKQVLLFYSYIAGSTTGLDASAFDTVFCPPTMSLPPENATGGIAASSSSELKWAGGGMPHCQLDVRCSSNWKPFHYS